MLFKRLGDCLLAEETRNCGCVRYGWVMLFRISMTKAPDSQPSSPKPIVSVFVLYPSTRLIYAVSLCLRYEQHHVSADFVGATAIELGVACALWWFGTWGSFSQILDYNLWIVRYARICLLARRLRCLPRICINLLTRCSRAYAIMLGQLMHNTHNQCARQTTMTHSFSIPAIPAASLFFGHM